MILTRDKATRLLCCLEEFCKGKGITLPRNKDERYIKLAKMVMQRYGSVVLVDDVCKTLCNNPKALKRWVMLNSTKNTLPCISPCCDSLARRMNIK